MICLQGVIEIEQKINYINIFENINTEYINFSFLGYFSTMIKTNLGNSTFYYFKLIKTKRLVVIVILCTIKDI